MAEALGLTVDWDGAKREAIFTNGTKTIYFPIGSSKARTGDGGTVQMDTAAVIVNDRTFAPIRYLAEYFGFDVGWDGASRTVMITGASTNGFTDDELCEMAQIYYARKNGQTPPYVKAYPKDDGTVMIQIYEVTSNHIATWEWYTVDRVTGKGTSTLSGDIDLTEVL